MRKGLLKAIAALALSAAIIFPSGDTGLTVSAAAEQQVCTEHVHFEAEHYAASTVEPPKANKTSGSTIECDGDSTSIILSAETGAVIYYRVGNSGSYKKYTSPIKLTENSTIYTYAEKGGKKSSTVTYNYYLIPKLNISVSGSGKSKTVKVTTKTSGVKLYYSLSSDSSSKSTQYPSSGITVKKDCTVKIEAVKKDWKSETKSRNIIMDMSKYGKTDKLGSGKFSMPVAPDVACMRYNNGEEVDAEADCFYSSNSNSKYDTVGIYLSQGTVFIRLEANDTIVKGTTYDLAKSNSQMKSNVSISDFSAIDGGKEHQTGTDKVIEKAEIQFSTLDFTGKNASVMYFYILARDPKTGNKISLEGRSKFYITNSPHGKTTGSSSSTGTSSSSSDTKQLGASSFTEPVGGKGTVRYKGSTKSVYLSTNSYNDYDKFYFSFSSGESVELYIASNAKFNTGDTLTLSDMSGVDKGSGYVSLKSFGLKSAADFISSDNDAKSFDKIELKAVSVDYTGKKASTFYFYILAHDESGKKISLEGLIKDNLRNSKHGTSSGTGSGSSGTGTGTGSGTGTGTGSSQPTPLDVSKFTSLKAGEYIITYTDGTKKEDSLYKTSYSPTFDTFEIRFQQPYQNNRYQELSRHIQIQMKKVEFNTGDTLTLSDLNDNGAFVELINIPSPGINIREKDSFEKIEFKAVDMDYTGENPSVIYLNVVTKSGLAVEVLANVTTNSKSRRAAANNAGNGNAAGNGNGGRKVCTMCGGSKRCPLCNGRIDPNNKCRSCQNTKKCEFCKGTGFEIELTEKTCRSCDGMGKCRNCGGNGNYWNTTFNRRADCTFCGGSGRCRECDGLGFYA